MNEHDRMRRDSDKIITVIQPDKTILILDGVPVFTRVVERTKEFGKKYKIIPNQRGDKCL